MASPFRHLRAQYYDEDPARARALTRYHLREHETAGLFATETSHPSHFHIPQHSHDLPSFYLVLEGALTEFADRSENALAPCTVVYTPAGHIHRNRFHAQGGRCFLVELSGGWLDRLGAAGTSLQAPQIATQEAAKRIAVLLYREFRNPDALSPLAAEGLTLELLAQLARWSDGSAADLPSWLALVHDLLQDRFAERVTLAELAGAVGVHPVHLTRSFRRAYRCTPGQYQRRLRVEHASRLLSSTRRPLAEIAQTTGFADQAHFTRVFRAQTGWTPARYRTRFGVA